MANPHELGLLRKMEYFRKLFISLCPQYPEPSRESLLRWSAFEISVVEDAIRIAALKFADTEPQDIYRFITCTARNRMWGERRKTTLVINHVPKGVK